MSIPQNANSQLSDSINQATLLEANTPGGPMSEMYHATVQAIAEAAQNIISSQQQIPVTMQTATSPGAETLYSVNNPSNMLDNTKTFE